MGNNSFSCYKYLAQGKSHIKNNTPCQDYCNYFSGEDFSIIALSDGAGSCKFSQIGSKILVDSIIEFLKNNYETIMDKNEDEIKSLIISYLSKKIEQTALEKKIEEKQLSATLLFVLSYKNRAMYGHIGDGVIACDLKNELIVLDRGENGEFKNETVFFRKNIKKDYLKLRVIPNKDILSFFCFSDGLEPVLISFKEDILSPKLQTYSSWIYKYESKTYEEEITDDLNYIASSNYAIDDDLSLIIMNINSDKNYKIREYKEYVIDPINDDLKKKLEIQNNYINSLEKKLENQNNSISSLEKKLENQNNSINSLEKKLENQNNSISSLELENQNNSISSLEKKLESQNDSINSLENILNELHSNNKLDKVNKKNNIYFLMIPMYLVQIIIFTFLLLNK